MPQGPRLFQSRLTSLHPRPEEFNNNTSNNTSNGRQPAPSNGWCLNPKGLLINGTPTHPFPSIWHPERRVHEAFHHFFVWTCCNSVLFLVSVDNYLQKLHEQHNKCSVNSNICMFVTQCCIGTTYPYRQYLQTYALHENFAFRRSNSNVVNCPDSCYGSLLGFAYMVGTGLTYSPNWWFNDDLPWQKQLTTQDQKTKNYLKPTQACVCYALC